MSEEATPRGPDPQRPPRRVGFRLTGSSLYLRKWAGIGILVGLVSGVAALTLIWLIDLSTEVFLVRMVGLVMPEEGTDFQLRRAWLLPLMPALGGLIGGWIVWKYAPSASGIGTDAAIGAFHRGEDVPIRTTLIKLVTSALTIGTGGTSGREGPIAQVGAGAGHWVATRLRLSRRDRGIALAAGLGSGVAAIFRAPLAGALIGAEVFYREDFEAEAIIPTVIASSVSYSMVGFVHGFTPVFATSVDRFHFGHPSTIVFYVVLGALCALAARGAVRMFFPVERLFKRLPLPVATTLGGLLTGLITLIALGTIGFPTPTGTGHAWLQLALLRDPSFFSPGLSVTMLLLAAAGLELLSSTATLGSGNSGGIFGPSLVVGGFLGAAFGEALSGIVPSLVPDPTTYAVVGMMAYFSAVAKAPIGTLIMVVEMTGGYGLLAPAMVAVVVAYILSGPGSIFRHQVRNRLKSGVHAAELEPLVLRETKVEDVMQEGERLGADMPLEDASTMLVKTGVPMYVVLDGDHLAGVVRPRDLGRVPEWDRAGRTIADVMIADHVTVRRSDTLFSVLSVVLESDVELMPVVDRNDRFCGVVGRAEIAAVVRDARRQLEQLQARAAKDPEFMLPEEAVQG